MLGCCIIFHLINKVFPLFPFIFTGKWRNLNLQALKGLILPTICLNVAILLKQNNIKHSGPSMLR